MRTLLQLSQALRARLKQHQITQDALRSRVGVSRQTLTNILGGSSDYKVTNLLAICDQLGLDLVLMPRELNQAGMEASRDGVIKTVVQKALDGISDSGNGGVP
ncbi:helix-turn-helix transcriptional regulator [Actimicrobium antarcticum]|uniref:HTH cro/C1-type domain-containing protein n=1 Tax=Actimicrobium antarcticum TaxID=1051899 RepID=A0ABP7TTR3_9BURK